MRRKDREITDFKEIITIIEKCDVCRIAFSVNDRPYIVPLNFGYSAENGELILYFHCASQGQKLDMLNENPEVCIEMDCSHRLVINEDDSECTMEYESVIGFGKASIISDMAEKIKALDILMSHYNKKPEYKYDEGNLRAVTVFKVVVAEVTGKRLKKK